jgi:hypothetical protein
MSLLRVLALLISSLTLVRDLYLESTLAPSDDLENAKV